MSKQDSGCGIQDAKPGAALLNPVLLQRVRWRSRRGLLELDIVLGRFIEMQYPQLSDAEKMLFEVMLDMPDNPLWDMIAGKRDAENNEQQALLELIRAA